MSAAYVIPYAIAGRKPWNNLEHFRSFQIDDLLGIYIDGLLR